MSDTRIRFDDKYSDIVTELLDTGYFKNLGQVALFAGVLGLLGDKKEQARGTRDVRLNVLLSEFGASQLIDGIYVMKNGIDSDLLAESEISNKAKFFEEYVNGGLSTLWKESQNGKAMAVYVPQLIAINLGE